MYLGSVMKPKEEKKTAEEKLEKEKNAIVLTGEQLNGYSGDYWSDELGVAYRLGVVDSKLKIVALMDAAGFPHTSNIPGKAFEPTAANDFEMEGAGLAFHFLRDQQQSVKGFTLDAGRTRGMIFTRRDGSG